VLLRRFNAGIRNATGCDILFVMRCFIVLAIALLAAGAAEAQECPSTDKTAPVEASQQSALHGTLVFHDELRKWLGIKLDRQACGQSEIEIYFQNLRNGERRKRSEDVLSP
jgi:hypothetical protein